MNKKESALLDALDEAAAHIADMTDLVHGWEDAADKDELAELIEDFRPTANDGLVALDDLRKQLKGYANG